MVSLVVCLFILLRLSQSFIKDIDIMFKLELIRDTPLGQKDEEDTTVSEAIFSVYSDYETDIHLFFGDFLVCLSRRGDISDIYNDIVDIFMQLEHGSKIFFMNFLSSSFTTRWDFELIKPGTIKINAKWFDVVYYDKKQSMIKQSEIEVPISEFKDQWKKILLPIKEDILTLEYDRRLTGFDFLERLN